MGRPLCRQVKLRAKPAVIDFTERNSQIEALFAGLEGPEWLQVERDAYKSADSIDVIRSRVMDRL